MRQAALTRWSAVRATVAFAAVVCMLAAMAAPAGAVIVYRCGSTVVNLCRINPNGSGQAQLTSDGSYEGVSLDPAGTRMVFERGSALYSANELAQSPVGPLSNAASQAKISFDGSTVVNAEYYEGRPLICALPTSAPSPSCSFEAQFPAFTPGGELVASFFDKSTTQFVVSQFAVGAKGPTAPPPLVTDAEGSVLESAVSPNGETLAAVVTPDFELAGGYIALFSMSTGQLIKKLTNGATDEDPAWSPDGTQLVFARGDSLYTTTPNGSPGSEKLLVNEGDEPTWGGSETVNQTPVPGANPTPTVGVTLPAIRSLALGAHTVHAKSGFKLRVTLAAAASVVVEFKLVVQHHKHKTLKLVGSVSLTGKAGVQSFTIKRVHGHRLAPGDYELIVFAQAGTVKSTQHTLSLTVKH
jgi:WD40-like Beta Propeller Repeat